MTKKDVKAPVLPFELSVEDNIKNHRNNIPKLGIALERPHWSLKIINDKNKLIIKANIYTLEQGSEILSFLKEHFFIKEDIFKEYHKKIKNHFSI
jgi:hypothetical protein